MGCYQCDVSIHAPVQAGDKQNRFIALSGNQFQSTPPYKRATEHFFTYSGKRLVSIHAPVQAGDPSYKEDFSWARLVSIHAPVQAGDTIKFFYSILYNVSIHAPVQAGDRQLSFYFLKQPCFNPRPRTSGRPQARSILQSGMDLVSIHAPVQAGDCLLLTD